MAKKQDKTEDGIVRVEEALGRTEQFIENNQRMLTIIVAVIVVLVLGFFSFKKFYIAPREAEAKSQMFTAEQYFDLDSLDLALNGDGMYPGFLKIIDDYGITSAANLAKYYTGIIYLHKGDYNNSIKYLKSYKVHDQIIGPMSRGAIGDAYLELNDPSSAVEYYLKAADLNDNEFTAPLFYEKAGWTYEQLGKYSDALNVYQKIKKDYPKSNEAREIDKYISRAKGLMGK